MKFFQLIRLLAYGGVLSSALAGCKRSSGDATSNTSSLIFDSASPEAQQALANPVDFRLTEDNFAEWEAAQRNLDALPRSALPSGGSSAGNPIDRAVERLESSPRGRTAIERTGLTVRDFVLETIALAQATEALSAANSSSVGRIPPENLQFVQSHRSRVQVARRQPQASASDEQASSQNTDVVPASSPADAEAMDKAQGIQRSSVDTTSRVNQRSTMRDSTASIVRPLARDSARDTIPPPR
jgi:uncharacterized protein (DUF1778 family)